MNTPTQPHVRPDVAELDKRIRERIAKTGGTYLDALLALKDEDRKRREIRQFAESKDATHRRHARVLERTMATGASYPVAFAETVRAERANGNSIGSTPKPTPSKPSVVVFSASDDVGPPRLFNSRGRCIA